METGSIAGMLVLVAVLAIGGMAVGGGWIFFTATWVSVGGGSVVTSVGLAQPARIVIENKTHNITRNVLRITIPPFDLRNPQISYLKYYSTFLSRFQ